jgi:hypothetical protein
VTPRLSEAFSRARARLPRRTGTVLFVALVAGLLALVIAVVVTARPAFLGSYAGLEREYETLMASAHSDVGCDGCHVETGREAAAYQIALVGDFYGGLVDKQDRPQYVRIETPTNEACLSCHREDWSDDASRTTQIPHPAHLRVSEVERECVECHKWTAHNEEYIDRHKEMPFSGVCASFDCHAGFKTVEECQTCHHAVQEEEPQWVEDHPQAVADIGPGACVEECHTDDQCRQCHTTGERPEFPAVMVDPELRTIEREHVKDDWMQTHGDFGLEDDTLCFECHVDTAECDACHSIRPEFHGSEDTWLNKHADFVEDEEDERRCLTCHEKDWCEECHEQFEDVR